MTDSTGTENGGLHQEETKLRPAGNLRTHQAWYPHLSTSGCLFHLQNQPGARFPAIQEIQPKVIDERGDNDWSGNRTSAPVRITRDKETLQHVRIKGLFLAEKAPDMPEASFLPGLTANGCCRSCKGIH